MNSFRSIIILVTLFSIAMAFLESAVVVYLRELIYPEGFNFPLKPFPGKLALTEYLREIATIIMLVMIGLVAGRTFSERFSWFIYSFAIWDIFYYVFLKVLIDWPDSLLTWDVLFLIPLIWTGPVITPVIVSLTMILLACVILNFARKGADTRILPGEWVNLITGATLIFIAFIWDFSMYILRYFSIREIWTQPGNQDLYQKIISYVPQKFNWGMFIAGELFIILMIFFYFKRIKKQNHLQSEITIPEGLV